MYPARNSAWDRKSWPPTGKGISPKLPNGTWTAVSKTWRSLDNRSLWPIRNIATVPQHCKWDDQGTQGKEPQECPLEPLLQNWVLILLCQGLAIKSRPTIESASWVIRRKEIIGFTMELQELYLECRTCMRAAPHTHPGNLLKAYSVAMIWVPGSKMQVGVYWWPSQ